MRDKYVKLKRINAIIATIRRGEFINYAAIARKYKYNRSVVFKRIKGLIKFKKDADLF
jgi:hypothetical protein